MSENISTYEAIDSIKKSIERMRNSLSEAIDEASYYRDVNEALHFELQQKHEEVRFLKEKIERLEGVK